MNTSSKEEPDIFEEKIPGENLLVKYAHLFPANLRPELN